MSGVQRFQSFNCGFNAGQLLVPVELSTSTHISRTEQSGHLNRGAMKGYMTIPKLPGSQSDRLDRQAYNQHRC